MTNDEVRRRNVFGALLPKVIIILLVSSFVIRHSSFSEELPFLLGADLSLAPMVERSGVTFKDGGQPTDIFAIFRAHGANCVRLRLFVHPDGKNGVVNDLPYTVALAQRVKTAGLLFCLDFHYSDTWADPGNQSTPVAWQGLALAPLTDRLRNYTADTIRAFREAEATPDLVQIGNEIAPGMLWPVGKVGQGDAAFDALAELLKAGAAGVRMGMGTGPMPKIMLHIHGGEHPELARWFFDGITRHNVPFDLIGLSYYPFYKGTLADLGRTMNLVARTYHKPVVVAETAHLQADAPWLKSADRAGLTYPLTPDGQRDFLRALIATVRATPDGLGAGILYWYPESVPVKNPAVNDWWGGQAAMFDRAGDALPAFTAFGPGSKTP